MKIGIVTNLYPPFARGGAENVIVRTVEQLLGLGHDIFIITSQPKREGAGPVIGSLSVERVYRFFPKNVYYTLDDYKQPWLLRLLWHILDTFRQYSATVVREILLEEQPDIVITHNLKGLGLRIPRAIQDLGIPHIHVMHDLQLVTPSGLRMFGSERESWYVKPAYMMYRALCRQRIGKPALVLSPSHYLMDEYAKAGFFRGVEVRYMPNPSPKAHGAMRDTFRSPGPLRLLFIGQLGFHKGLEFLLDAFAKYEGDARLSIVGGGPLRSLVEERAKFDTRIKHLGYMPPEEVMKCIAGADAVIVPSLCYENSPTVIYEALSIGVPLIASRIGGVGELIQEGKTGYLFTPGDEADFLRVLRLMDDRKEDFATRASVLRESIAPYELPKYAERLVSACTEAIAITHPE